MTASIGPQPCSAIQAAARAQGRGGGEVVLGAVQLAVGQAAVVIDDRDDVDAPAPRVRICSERCPPVAQCPGRSNLGSCIVSICNNAPGCAHSKRLVVCLGAERRRCETAMTPSTL